MISMISLVEYITCSSSMSLEEINIIEFCMFHVLIDTVFYFYHHQFHIQYNFSYKSYLLLLVCNNLFLLVQKGS